MTDGGGGGMGWTTREISSRTLEGRGWTVSENGQCLCGSAFMRVGEASLRKRQVGDPLPPEWAVDCSGFWKEEGGTGCTGVGSALT